MCCFLLHCVPPPAHLFKLNRRHRYGLKPAFAVTIQTVMTQRYAELRSLHPAEDANLTAEEQAVLYNCIGPGRRLLGSGSAQYGGFASRTRRNNRTKRDTIPIGARFQLILNETAKYTIRCSLTRHASSNQPIKTRERERERKKGGEGGR